MSLYMKIQYEELQRATENSMLYLLSKIQEEECQEILKESEDLRNKFKELIYEKTNKVKILALMVTLWEQLNIARKSE